MAEGSVTRGFRFSKLCYRGVARLFVLGVCMYDSILSPILFRALFRGRNKCYYNITGGSAYFYFPWSIFGPLGVFFFVSILG